jgi:hypothetical protein
MSDSYPAGRVLPGSRAESRMSNTCPGNHVNTLKKNQQGQPLTKSHHRWAWMAGATAAAAAPHAQAATAQISLINNQIDTLTGDHLSVALPSHGPG